jgi:hypothetical protein
MTIERASDNPFPSVLFVEGDPEALADDPASGQRRLAVGTDHLLYLVDPSGVKTQVGGGLADPMTTRGDIIIRNASNVTARLGRGSSGQVLRSDGTDVAWATPSAGGLTRSTAGTTTVGGSFDSISGSKVLLKKVTLASAGLIASVTFHVKGGTTNLAALGVALRGDSSGSPSDYVAMAAAPAAYVNGTGAANNYGMYLSTTARWFSIPLGYWAAAGDYWLCVVGSPVIAGGAQIAYSSGTGSDRTVNAPTVGVLKDGDTVSTGTNDYSIYADILR